MPLRVLSAAYSQKDTPVEPVIQIRSSKSSVPVPRAHTKLQRHVKDVAGEATSQLLQNVKDVAGEATSQLQHNIKDVNGEATSQLQRQESGRTHRSSPSSARRSRHIASPTSITASACPIRSRLRASCTSCSSSTRSNSPFAALSERQQLELALTLVLVVKRRQREWRSSGVD
jgi:hypothetical protein